MFESLYVLDITPMPNSTSASPKNVAKPMKALDNNKVHLFHFLEVRNVVGAPDAPNTSQITQIKLFAEPVCCTICGCIAASSATFGFALFYIENEYFTYIARVDKAL